MSNCRRPPAQRMQLQRSAWAAFFLFTFLMIGKGADDARDPHKKWVSRRWAGLIHFSELLTSTLCDQQRRAHHWKKVGPVHFGTLVPQTSQTRLSSGDPPIRPASFISASFSFNVYARTFQSPQCGTDDHMCSHRPNWIMQGGTLLRDPAHSLLLAGASVLQARYSKIKISLT